MEEPESKAPAEEAPEVDVPRGDRPRWWIERHKKDWLHKTNRLASTLPDYTLTEIIEEIPRYAYAGILLSLEILTHDFLRSTDKEKKQEGASEFLKMAGSPAFMKNMAALEAEAQRLRRKGKGKGPAVEWDKGEK